MHRKEADNIFKQLNAQADFYEETITEDPYGQKFMMKDIIEFPVHVEAMEEPRNKQRSLQKPRERPPSLLREFGTLGIKIGVVAVISVIIFTFVFGFYYNNEPGMFPSVKDGDLVMYYRLNSGSQVRDLVVVSFQGQQQVRRIVAIGGDTVDITEQGLIINGSLQQEREIYQLTHRFAEGTAFPLQLGPNEVFLLGDAREDSIDSRIYGPVNRDDIQGTVISILRRRNL